MELPTSITVGWREYKSARINPEEFLNKHREEFNDWRRSMELEIEDISRDEFVEWLYDYLENNYYDVNEMFRYAETEDVHDFDIG